MFGEMYLQFISHGRNSLSSCRRYTYVYIPAESIKEHHTLLEFRPYRASPVPTDATDKTIPRKTRITRRANGAPAIQLNNFTKSLTRRLIKLNEFDRGESRWGFFSFSIGRRLRRSDNFTMPRLLSYIAWLQPGMRMLCRRRAFFFHEFPPLRIVIPAVMFQRAQPRPLLNYNPRGLFFSIPVVQRVQ